MLKTRLAITKNRVLGVALASSLVVFLNACHDVDYIPGEGSSSSSVQASTSSSQAAADGSVVMAIRASRSGRTYTGSDGIDYLGDGDYASDSVVSSTNTTIEGTEDQRIYASERTGDFTYELPLDNGVYDVTLKMSEKEWAAVGERVFSVSIEGAMVMPDIDIFSLAGSANMMLDIEAENITVDDGSMSIDFVASVDEPSISAVVVRVSDGVASSSSSSTSSVPAVLDADSDSVVDADDVCPATPTGETVDATGCSDSQLDTDSDTVMNNVDICPATPAGETANDVGCSSSQVDTDSDGVFDHEDQCIDIEQGTTPDPDKLGCPLVDTDADNDGVDDTVDQCDNTPSGESANAEGCSPSQVDTDNDTVMDNADTCPATPAGETANVAGCAASQLDADSDGVMDDVDQCPSVPKGSIEDTAKLGCPYVDTDSDDDGVDNGTDQCDNTPIGEPADVNGCAPSQLDTDADGVSDSTDICPATASGESVDTDGCALSQLDTDNDGVDDATDMCPSTVSGVNVDAVGCEIVPINAAELFENNCVGCHGVNGAGPPDIRGKNATDMRNALSTGMVNKVNSLSPEEVDAIGELISTWTVPTPTIDGVALFVDNCGMCHKGNGMGSGTYSDRTGSTTSAIKSAIENVGSMESLKNTFSDEQIQAMADAL